MKITALVFTLNFLSIVAFAQKNTDQLNAEITALSKQLQAEKEKTAYFKKVLELRSVGTEITLDSVNIKIVEVRGKSAENLITIKGLITYLGQSKRNLQFSAQQLVDPKGNTLEAFTAVKSNDEKKTFRIEHAETGIPYSFTVQFMGANEKIPTLSLLRLQIFGKSMGSTVNYNFKGLDLTWN